MTAPSRTKSRRHLLLTRTGKQSLHPTWTDNHDQSRHDQSRSYDLIALSYDPEAVYPQNAQDDLITIPGPKVSGYIEWLHQNEWVFDEYSYIGLFDDDIATTQQQIERVFKYIATLGLSVGQPALSEDSFYAIPLTRQHKSFLHRWTNWVEIMAPVFRADFLKKCMGSLKFNPYGGCCTEVIWTTLCDHIPGEIAIIDATPIKHTRRTATAGSGDAQADNAKIAQLRKRLVMAQTGIFASIDNLCGVTKEGGFLHLGEEKFIHTIANDFKNKGMLLHEQVNPLGNAYSTRGIYRSYIDRLYQNAEAMQLGGASEKLLEELSLTAIQAGMLYEQLKEI